MLEQRVLEYIGEHRQEALDLLLRLAVLPAFSGREEQRAAFCKDWLQAQGAQGVYIDEALNVVFPINCEGEGPIRVFMAHSDVVFPDDQPLPLRQEEGKIFCPGIGDNSANVVALLMAMKYLAQTGLSPADGGVLLVINSGEEGLGNLKGCKALMERYGRRVRELVTFDSMDQGYAVNRAVGSMRYRVSVKTAGGHSFNAFGNKNAITHLAELICALDKVVLPKEGKTTYNVGRVTGGTSVNTIAQDAEMLYEFRSDSAESLAYMKDFFERTVKAFDLPSARITVTPLGERPCGVKVDEGVQGALEKRAEAAYLAHYGREVSFVPGSTDCNIPLSIGIPALCVGCCQGKGAHTREEYVEIDSLLPGLCLCFEMILPFF